MVETSKGIEQHSLTDTATHADHTFGLVTIGILVAEEPSTEAMFWFTVHVFHPIVVSVVRVDCHREGSHSLAYPTTTFRRVVVTRLVVSQLSSTSEVK